MAQETFDFVVSMQMQELHELQNARMEVQELALLIHS